MGKSNEGPAVSSRTLTLVEQLEPRLLLSGDFAAAVNYATGAGPLSVISADFNGDGKADLAVPNGSNTVSVLLGIGDGAFTAKVDYDMGASPVSVISSDFNGDGQADLAVANYGDNTVSLLLGNGDGTFAARDDYTTGIGPYSVISADFNGDGKADLAVANCEDHTVSVLLHNTDVTPPSSSVVALPAYTNSTTFTVNWSGSDDANGSGIAGYDVFVSDDGSSFTAWTTATPDTSATYTGQMGHTYQFYSVATDNAGNREAVPGQPDATISVWPTESKTLQGKDNKWTFTDSDGTPVTVAWSGTGSVTIERWVNPAQADHRGNIRSVAVNTTDAKSSLVIATKSTSADTAGRTVIEAVTVEGSLKAFKAGNALLAGDFTVTGSLGALVLGNVAAGRTIAIQATDASSDPQATPRLTFGQVSDANLTSAIPIKSLTAIEWLNTDSVADTISAPWIGSMAIKGDARRKPTAIAGDSAADLDLGADAKGVSLGTFTAAGVISGAWALDGGAKSITVGSSAATWQVTLGTPAAASDVGSLTSKVGDIDGTIAARSIGRIKAKGSLVEATITLSRGPDAKLLALGSLTAGQWIDASRILSAGKIGTVAAGGIRNSTVFAGVATTRDVQGVGGAPDGVLDLPQLADLAAPLPVTNLVAGIKGVTIKGMKDAQKQFVDSFVNSNIAAGSLGKVALGYARFDNDGNASAHDVPFGLAGLSLASQTYQDADGAHKHTWRLGQALPAWFDDLTLRLV